MATLPAWSLGAAFTGTGAGPPLALESAVCPLTCTGISIVFTGWPPPGFPWVCMDPITVGTPVSLGHALTCIEPPTAGAPESLSVPFGGERVAASFGAPVTCMEPISAGPAQQLGAPRTYSEPSTVGPVQELCAPLTCMEPTTEDPPASFPVPWTCMEPSTLFPTPLTCMEPATPPQALEVPDGGTAIVLPLQSLDGPPRFDLDILFLHSSWWRLKTRRGQRRGGIDKKGRPSDPRTPLAERPTYGRVLLMPRVTATWWRGGLNRCC